MRWVAAIALSGAIAVADMPRAGLGQVDVGISPEVLHRDFVRAGAVDYPGLATQTDRLKRYLWLLAGGSEESIGQLPKQGRLAFWINAYNLLTIDLIVRERVARKGQLQSIKDIPAAWSRPKWTVAGRSVTLDQIEHDILRKEFREPRIHFALVCASKSCPALRPTEFRAEFLDAQLDSAAREFVLDPSRNDFTPRDGGIRISKIFDWYGKDFVGVYSDSTFERLYGRETGAVLAYVSRFLPADSVAALRAKRARVTYLPYDWSLNVAPPR